MCRLKQKRGADDVIHLPPVLVEGSGMAIWSASGLNGRSVGASRKPEHLR